PCPRCSRRWRRRSGATDWSRATGPPATIRRFTFRELTALGAVGAGAAGRADPGARARPLLLRPPVRREGPALLAGVRAAPLRFHPPRDRVPAVAGAARRVRPAARRGSGRADPADRSAAGAGRQAPLAALHGGHRRAALQHAPAAAHLLRPLRGPADAAAAHDRDGAARAAGGLGRPAPR